MTTKRVRAALLAAGLTAGVVALGGVVSPAGAAEPTTVCATGCDHTTIQAAVNAAKAGDSITVSGDLTVTGQTTINKDVTVTGVDGATVTQTSAHVTFLITGGGATLSDLTITSDKPYAREFVYIGANDVTLDGNTIYGPEQTTPMDKWVSNRGFVTQGSITGFSATGNTIHSMRSGAYLNPRSGGTISDNTLYDTKGDFLIDNARFTFSGNRAGDPSQRSEWGFVVFANTDPALYTDLEALSVANNRMTAWDQRPGGEEFVAPLIADDCKDGGWKDLDPGFKNQGQCVKFVNTRK
ncbi:right-handed parallel beta-helix repeat-containing protein [Geodermatophilus sp. SYSU D01105]